MFSPEEKAKIADAVEKVLLSLNHPEMLKKNVCFYLHVDGAESWSWADIDPNWAVKAARDADFPSSRVVRFGNHAKPSIVVYAIKARSRPGDAHDALVPVGGSPDGGFAFRGTVEEAERHLNSIGYVLAKGQKIEELRGVYPELVKVMEKAGFSVLPDMRPVFLVTT